MIDSKVLKQKIEKVIKCAEDNEMAFKNEDQKEGYILALNGMLIGLILKSFDDTNKPTT